MLIDTDNLVSVESFQKEFDRYLAAAQQGRGPVAITRDSRVVGVFMSPEEYEALHGAEIRDLLQSRERGPTVSHDEACKQLDQVLKRPRRRA
jgi:PHD/YefM family antitoxin component YafN of YafNO toxin-antitoxin module